MKIYIAGPITGVPDYKEQFKKAQKVCEERGLIVVNPAYLPEGLGKNEVYMHICYSMIDVVDGVLILDGWKDSLGTKCELEYAIKHNKRIVFQSDIETLFK